MSYIGSWKIGDLVTFYANTHNASNGSAQDADAVPTYRVYEDETATPILNGSMALIDASNTVGFYSEQITASSGNGFEKGKSYGIYIQAVVGGVTGTAHRYFQIEAEVTANTVTPPVTAGNVTGSVFGNVNGSVASVVGNVGGNVNGSVGSVVGSVGSVTNPVTAGNVTGSVFGNVNGSVNSVTSPVTVGTNNDKTGYGLATGTLLEAIADKVWDEAIAGHLTAGSVGAALNSAGGSGDPWSTSLPGAYTPGQAGYILASRMPTGTVLVGDKTGFSLSNPQTFDLIGNVSGTLTNVRNVLNPVVAGVVTGSVLGNVNGSVASVTQPVGINTGTFLSALADAVWDEQISGHLAAGTTATALNAAGSAGDPWSTTLPGAYTGNQAGNILASRMPTGTVLVGDKTGFSLSSPQSFNLIGNISGTVSNVVNVVNPVVAGVVTGSVLGNVNGSVNSVTQGVGISTGSFLDALADKVWDEQLSGHLVAGSAGHTLFSRMPSGTVVVGTNNDKTGYGLTNNQVVNFSGTITNVMNVINPVVAGVVTGSVLGNVNGSVNSVTQPVGISTGSFVNAIADQVWNETLSEHLTAGSAGNALNGAGSAGDPWGTVLPGAYTATQAGGILASRMPTGTVIVGTNQDKTGYSLSGTQNINIVGNISGTFVGNIQGTISDITSALGNKIADFVLRRNLSSAESSSDGDTVVFRSPLGAFRKLVNRWKISGTTLTVYKEDDSTAAGTQALTGTAGADPITEVDTNG